MVIYCSMRVSIQPYYTVIIGCMPFKPDQISNKIPLEYKDSPGPLGPMLDYPIKLPRAFCLIHWESFIPSTYAISTYHH
jgi:hypothetical protein